MKRLHIGCGQNYMKGWENVDIFSLHKADCYANVSALPYPLESFDLVYACHVLEHVNRHLIIATLIHWRSLLKEKGILRLSVPNFVAIMEYYSHNGGKLKDVIGLLYGGQDSFLNEHKIVFDYELLSDYLIKTGFENIIDWYWSATDHKIYDDYSQAYLPHMDKEHGRLMSLNLEATKRNDSNFLFS